MLSRRDQVQAQTYVLGRLTRALVNAEPEAPESPIQRGLTGTFAGALVAALVAAGFAVYGFLVPGNATAWRTPGALVVDRDTGSRYVLDGEGRLRPVLNLASARLLLGERMRLERVASASLRGVGHGPAVGIPGAPDTLPSAAAGATMTWTACATGGGAVTVQVDADPVGGAALDGRAVAVDTGDGGRFLVWRGRRLRFAEPWLPRVLGYDDAVTAAGTWLSVLPAGPDITVVRPAGQGGPGPSVGGGHPLVGTVYAVGDRRYLLRADGLAPLGDLAARIVLGDPTRVAAGLGVEPVNLAPAVLAQVAESPAPVLAPELPASTPAPVPRPPGWTLCLRYRNGVLEPVVAPAPDRPVTVVPGGGALVVPGDPRQARPPNGLLTGAYLLTDDGSRFPVADADAAGRLGFPAATAVVVPEQFVNPIPTGPRLRVLNTAG